MLAKSEAEHVEPVIIEDDSARIAVRPAVAARRTVDGGITLTYLSLFESEIEVRNERFLSAGGMARSAKEIAAAALLMEPTDAAIVTLDRSVLIARGGACSFPLYWSLLGRQVEVTTALPIGHAPCISRTGLADSIAVVCVALQNEPNLSLYAPLAGWRRLRRASVSHLSVEQGLLSETPIDLANMPQDNIEYETLLADLRSAFDAFGAHQSAHTALVEWSGGFDSTLAAIYAKRHGSDLLAVSVRFPYYEFRFEDEIQRAAAATVDLPRECLLGEDYLPYTPPLHALALDEPATLAMAVARDMEMASHASRIGADRILVGQGGDQVFSEHMLDPVPQPTALSRAAFNAAGWRRVERARARMRCVPGYLRRSRLLYLHDARLDCSLKERFGVATRSPFSDIAVARCGMRWARWCSKSGFNAGKRVLADAFSVELPEVVVARRAKVSWDGVCARSYAQNARLIGDELERSSALLEHVGFDLRWLIRRLNDLAMWRRSSFGLDDRELFAAYALATWFSSWQIASVGDVAWRE